MWSRYTCQLFLRYKREIFILGVLGFLKTTQSFPKIPEEVRSLPKTSEVCRRRSYWENAYPQNQRSRGRYCYLFIYTWFSFLTWVWVNIFLEIVSSKTATTQVFQPGVRNWPASVSRCEIEVFNPQAWELAGISRDRKRKCIKSGMFTILTNIFLWIHVCLVILISIHIKLSISDKISWDTLLLRGFQMFYWLPEGKIKLFFPYLFHEMLCRCSSYLIENNKHPNLNDGEGGSGVDSFVLCSYPIWVQCVNNFVTDCLNRKSGHTS